MNSFTFLKYLEEEQRLSKRIQHTQDTHTAHNSLTVVVVAYEPDVVVS